jgi:hypothetical protein
MVGALSSHIDRHVVQEGSANMGICHFEVAMMRAQGNIGV